MKDYQHRMLEKGESIKPGDEWLVNVAGQGVKWVPIEGGKVEGESLVNRVRRDMGGPASAWRTIDVLEAEIAFLRQLLAQKESA